MNGHYPCFRCLPRNLLLSMMLKNLLFSDLSYNLSERLITSADLDQSRPAMNSNGDTISSSTGFEKTQYLYGQ